MQHAGELRKYPDERVWRLNSGGLTCGDLAFHPRGGGRGAGGVEIYK